MPRIRITDTELHYDRRGEGRPTLLFVHGMAGGGWVWEEQVARLAERFDCVTYDRRGHSRSGGGGDHSFATHSADLAALADALGLERPVVVGSSSGAVVTLELLHRYPGLAGAAVLSEPPLFSVDPDSGAELIAAIRPAVEEAVRAGGGGAIVESFLGVVCPGLWARLDEERRRANRANAGVVIPTLEEAASALTPEDLAALDTPIRVVTGTESTPPMPALARRLAEMLPDGRLVVLEGASHATYVDAAEAFAGIVADCAAELSGRSSLR